MEFNILQNGEFEVYNLLKRDEWPWPFVDIFFSLRKTVYKDLAKYINLKAKIYVHVVFFNK